MDFSCAFCLKTEDSDLLIELSSNLLFIGKSHYDFQNVFNDLFGIAMEDLQTNFICETCKDSVVQFVIFKSTVVSQMNQHRKMIMTQVEDFLRHTKRVEDVQVVRKIRSITLQIDDTASDEIPENTNLISCEVTEQQEEQEEVTEDFQYEEVISESESEDIVEDIQEIESNYVCCDKCEEVSTNEESLELHEFLKHSLLGIHIENEVEMSEELSVGDDGAPRFVRKCNNCFVEFEDAETLTEHLITIHIDEILMNLFDTTSISLEIINEYIGYIRELMANKDLKADSKINATAKEYFYLIYSTESIRGQEEVKNDINEIVEEEEVQQFVVLKPSKAEKVTVNMTDDTRAWVRKEISLRKTVIKSDPSGSRCVYRCAYCNVYSSNSAPGFRYHLMSKHLKDQQFGDLQEIISDFIPPPKVNFKTKNTCLDCNLKLKDQKLFNSHRNAHELFDVISKYYSFPSCNTCNTLFVNSKTLKLHLLKHDKNEDVKDPIPIPSGAILLQGKQLCHPTDEPQDENFDSTFSWNCGHCSKKFEKEVSCRRHLLMSHAGTFTCPIDKREFSGFKAVSLFCHHLKNKHSDLFPSLVFSCTFCKTEFTSVYDKLSHMKSCSFKKFSCDHCGKKFFKKGDLEAHLRFVSGELYFQCKNCHKKCETMSDLKIHLRSHTKEKPFSCTICNKRFRTLATRSAHLEGHNSNVIHNCFCGKSFKQRQMYRRHMKANHEKDSRLEKL